MHGNQDVTTVQTRLKIFPEVQMRVWARLAGVDVIRSGKRLSNFAQQSSHLGVDNADMPPPTLSGQNDRIALGICDLEHDNASLISVAKSV
jgi:hypothetical protein